MPTLKQLISIGETSPLNKAMSRDEVCEVLGDCEGHYDYGDTTTEKRGPFQLVFQAKRLSKVEWFLSDDGTTTYEITDGGLTTTTTVNEFLDYCDREGIPWSIESSLSFDRQLAIRTCKSVFVIFDLDQRELQKVSVELA
jgi:hypothetical protein